MKHNIKYCTYLKLTNTTNRYISINKTLNYTYLHLHVPTLWYTREVLWSIEKELSINRIYTGRLHRFKWLHRSLPRYLGTLVYTRRYSRPSRIGKVHRTTSLRFTRYSCAILHRLFFITLCRLARSQESILSQGMRSFVGTSLIG